jgi:putative ABC transport system ATP-binding protein
LEVSPTPALSLRAVSKNYTSGSSPTTALDNVTIGLQDHDILCVMGRSGSGKTTLLKVSAGFIRPDVGTVQLYGTDLYAVPDQERVRIRRTITGFMFQEDILVETMTVKENVELPLIIEGYRKDAREKLVRKALDDVGLVTQEDRRPSEVSGGERRRISLARALVKSPKILFLDEPTSNLDTHTASTIVDLLRSLNSTGATIVLSTHDYLAAKHFSKTIRLTDGRVSAPSL